MPDPRDHEPDREQPTTKLPVADNEVPSRSDHEGDHEQRGGLLAAVDEMRFAQQSDRTTGDRIEFAIHGAYAMDDSVWRTANILFAYTIGSVGTVVCDIIRWAFFDRLSRFLLAVPVLLAILFVANRIPLIGWAVPDQWDVSTWIAPDQRDLVEVPIVPRVER